jgi:hypothetical protein
MALFSARFQNAEKSLQSPSRRKVADFAGNLAK